jgi:hypothetical protein
MTGARARRRLIVMALAMATLLGPAPAMAEDAAPAPCKAPEWSQFDFWLGTWNARWDALPNMPAGKGRNRIEKILGGCVVEENFTTDEAEPLVGRSVSVYSPQRGGWLQTWVDNQGSYLDFAGGWKDGRMVLGRASTGRDGKPQHQRMTFENIRQDAFDWRWETSPDGKAWALRWLIHYDRAR